MEIKPKQRLTCAIMSCLVLEAGIDLALSLLDSGVTIKPCAGEIPPVGKKQAIFLFRGLNLSPDPEFEKQHLDKRKWQEPSSKTKNWAARFKGGVDEGHQKGPGGELGI